MKLNRAMEIINEPYGYIVMFEVRGGSVLASDMFPDLRAGEKPLESISEAWLLAEKFAAKAKNVVNVCVGDTDYRPISDRRLNTYP